MAIEKVSTLLQMADRQNTAVIGFNCTDYNMAYSVAAAAEELHKPVIIMLYPEHCTLNRAATPPAFAGMVAGIVEKMDTPIGLHLDHCGDYGYIVDSIRGGFSSVMYDGSMLPAEENVKNTRKVVETAHILGADVEAELGHVGFAAAQDEDKEDMFTKPETARKFAEDTGVDSLAIAIGSAHGIYVETPRLDLARLDEINAATDVPLVLHGGSGIPDDQLHEAFRRGINKFNVGTEFFMIYYESVQEYCRTRGREGNMFDLPGYVQGRLMDYLRVKMQLSRL